MEHFVVSARKYRPQTFKDVVGQEAITNTLINAIENNHLAQALLFTGPRGVGKTTCARILAKMINSDGSQTENEDFAFNIFELDAASNNSVDDIRNLTDQVRIPPQIGKYKVYIIDEVHMLSASAFNAFLKTLEEPPKHCIFILATTEKHKIIPTILSRCQIFDFKRITVADVKEYLKYIASEQGVEADEDALHIIAQKADGAMRDALSIFDRVVSFAGNKLTREAVANNLNVLDYQTYISCTDLILKNDIPKLLVKFNDILARGFDGHHFIAGLASHFRDLLVVKSPETVDLLEVGDESKQNYLKQSEATDQSFLLEAIQIANTCDLQYKASKNQRLLVELALMRLASLTHSSEKKKTSRYIIPPSYFKSKGIEPIKVDPILPEVPIQKQPVEQEEKVEEVMEAQAKRIVEKRPEIILSSRKSTSGLSLKSIARKKEHELKQIEVIIDEEDLPEDDFTEKELLDSWHDYHKKLERQGQRNLASILKIDEPKVKEHTIYLEFPNETNKVELERNQGPLLQFIRKKLNNFKINLDITVNETIEKQYVFSPVEKYQRLIEKNPSLELLKKKFDLDI
ncbi:MAG: DNA polymerase III subunit gamma/tau [bacterium]